MPMPMEAVKRHDADQAQPRLAFSQQLWLSLHRRGWGAWANVSLCVSVPARDASPAFLCAAAQALCDANMALRTRYEVERGDTAVVVAPSDFHLPLRVASAPDSEVEALRMAADFESNALDPFAQPPIQALVLTAAQPSGRHWLCLTMHHVNADNASIQALRSQVFEMLASREAQLPALSFSFADCAVWQRAECAAVRERLHQFWSRRLAGVSPRAPTIDMPLPATEIMLRPLRAVESRRLALLAQQLNTTSAMLLHLVFALIAARLQPNSARDDGTLTALACHVVSGREQHASRMQHVVGCLDTSIPVCIEASCSNSLHQLAARTRHAFAEALEHAALLPRGDFLRCIGREPSELFELLPHVNVMHAFPASSQGRAHA